MQRKVLRYNSWISESESSNSYTISEDDIAYAQENCKVVDALVKSELTKGLQKSSYSINFQMIVDVESIKEYIESMEKTDIEFVPDYFSTNKMKFTFKRNTKLDNGKYTLDFMGGVKNSYQYGVREFIIEWNADNKDQVLDIVNKSIEEVIKDVKKVRVLIQVKKRNLPDSLKPALKKRVTEIYNDVVDSFFYKGEIPEDYGNNLPSLIAEIYAGDKTTLSTIADIENEDLLDSIMKALEEMEETDVVKVIKAYLRSSRILKDI